MTDEEANDRAPFAVGVVAIGRNEGERLKRCLASVNAEAIPVVYVDSGSADGSCEAARSAACDVVELDMSIPFTAARARNAGFARLREIGPPTYVQFVDGDCEVDPAWLPAARRFLEENPSVAVVSGHVHERAREASVWNLLCDLEWNTPVGRTTACGGNALMRFEAIDGAGGFRDDLIAGEEPELCLRLSRSGWSIWRLDQDMVRHDAAMTQFSQWWRRMVRGGWAVAEGWALHGRGAERYNRRMLMSTLLWSFVVPVVAFACVLSALTVGPTALWAVAAVLALAYPAMMVRVAVGRSRNFGDRSRDALAYGFFAMIGKFANLVGVARYVGHRVVGGRARLIEYKGPRSSHART